MIFLVTHLVQSGALAAAGRRVTFQFVEYLLRTACEAP